MQYISTRGGITAVPFTETVKMGLATDGGLLLPRTIPRVDRSTFESWQGLSYQDLAFEVMARFIDDIPVSDLKALIKRSYEPFDHPDIAPLVHLDGLHILELFHGPTLAFKDIALQFLGNLFEYLLRRDDSFMNIIGATSGDTGSAAIYGVRGKERLNIFILHPHGRVSPIQERQMTSVTDANVFNIAIQGTFDDGQSIVKDIFGDVAFKGRYHLGAINSINWARILAQVVYYVASCLHITSHENDRATTFAVPTGNFGDIFAGYIAKKMLPEGCISKLVLATNANDILARMINQGDYSLGPVIATSSPSMDIQAASNFERYLYYLLDSSPQHVVAAMARFKEQGSLQLEDCLGHIRRDFVAVSVTEEEVLQTITECYRNHGYILDPHTAVGVRAALQQRAQGIPTVCLATAHPAKFAATVEQAIGRPLDLPASLAALLDLPTRCEIMAADRQQIQTYIANHALHR
ncbi:threonine synthase [Desulfofustis limnaeus]|uniref:Threonine synthase n=1 Tax=Desulfofustis limnaeus TaxID=2740163 RepID=A0ABM7W9Y7_9BACT|nr:threonine synthase [Desulfofustis limnaeus]BDD87796.1 threonine synthase [Desulfofustis limnaeus]